MSATDSEPPAQQPAKNKGGRPKKKAPFAGLFLRIPAERIEAIDRLAAKLGQKRSQVTRELLLAALASVEDEDKQ